MKDYQQELFNIVCKYTNKEIQKDIKGLRQILAVIKTKCSFDYSLSQLELLVVGFHFVDQLLKLKSIVYQKNNDIEYEEFNNLINPTVDNAYPTMINVTSRYNFDELITETENYNELLDAAKLVATSYKESIDWMVKRGYNI